MFLKGDRKRERDREKYVLRGDDLERLWRNMEDERVKYVMNMALKIYLCG